MKRELERLITGLCHELFGIDIEANLTRPEEQFGDYATGVSMKLSKQVGKNPLEVAEQLVKRIKESMSDKITEVNVAGPGFINLKLNNQVLLDMAVTEPTQTLKGKEIVVEYSDPNPFKVLHAGHLYTSVIGDAIANLLEVAGGNVYRVNFGGDVGLHVGKTLWAMIQDLGGENPYKLETIEPKERSEWMAKCYVEGTQAYDNDKVVKQKITELNKLVYKIHEDNDHESPLAKIYWTCRTWSYDYFDEFYKSIGSKFDKYYPESSVSALGLKVVNEQLKKGVFERSDGAIIFRGEPYGLHTRVFVNSEGIPTYEAKDVGLIMTTWHDYHFDKSVVITGNEQEQYMAVVLKAVEQFAPELSNATSHLTHGMVKLKGGIKMSSRLGNILRAVDVLNAAMEATRMAIGKDNNDTMLGAVKYAFLKNRTGGDLWYDPQESVSLEGNSGPYLQYAHARARSILSKSGPTTEGIEADLEPSEHSLLRKISEYPEIVEKAVDELAPHNICGYLYDLSQVFNRFYESSRVIGDSREQTRIKLVTKYADVLAAGLKLLNIPSPDRI